MHKPVDGNEEERAAWAEYYVSAAAKLGIPCVWWDKGMFTGSGELFGLINRETYEFVYPLVVEALLRGSS
jgi:endoglucanase